MNEPTECENCEVDLQTAGTSIDDVEVPYWVLTRRDGNFVEHLPFCSDECARQYIDERIADNTSMTVAEAAFEYAAAFADFHEHAVNDNDVELKELVAQVESAYDLDEANATLDAAGITRNINEPDDFKPFGVRVKDEDFPEWVCGNCGNRPRLKFKEKPPGECSYCGDIAWQTEPTDPIVAYEFEVKGLLATDWSTHFVEAEDCPDDPKDAWRDDQQVRNVRPLTYADTKPNNE